MSDTNSTDLTDVPCDQSLPTFRRNNYFYGKLLTVNDFRMEQQYFINKQRLANRLIHGVGVVCGLVVSQNPAPGAPSGSIIISPGLALDSCGREIIVASPFTYDLGKDPSLGDTSPAKIYIQYDFCGLDPATNVLKSSNCKDNCCYSTLQEGFKIVLQGPTSTIPADICTDWNNYLKDNTSNDKFCMCTCPDPTQDGVLLAEAQFTRKDGTITLGQITNSRERVLGNGTLYSLLECLKNEIDQDLPTIQEITWSHNETVHDWMALIQKQLMITFDRSMDTATINDNTVSATLECYNLNQTNPFMDRKDIAIKTELGTNPSSSNVQRTTVTIRLPEALGEYQNKIKESYSRLRLVIRVKGDFVLDKNGKSLDGNFLGGGGKSTVIRPTGDGVAGGLFESWINFRLPIATQMALQLSSPKLTLAEDVKQEVVKQGVTAVFSITPLPPEGEVFHNISVDVAKKGTTAKLMSSQATSFTGRWNINVTVSHRTIAEICSRSKRLHYRSSLSRRNLQVWRHLQAVFTSAAS